MQSSSFQVAELEELRQEFCEFQEDSSELEKVLESEINEVRLEKENLQDLVIAKEREMEALRRVNQVDSCCAYVVDTFCCTTFSCRNVAFRTLIQTYNVTRAGRFCLRPPPPVRFASNKGILVTLRPDPHLPMGP